MSQSALNSAKSWIQSHPHFGTLSSEGFRGSYQDSDPHQVVLNPCDETTLSKVFDSKKEDIEFVVQAANKAFRSKWSTLAPRERAKKLQDVAACIRKNAEELAAIEALNNGKLYKEALIDDLSETADVFDYYAGWIDKFYAEVCPVSREYLNYTEHEALGVCALIVPWNFPLLLAAWKIAPALAMGNTVIVKPAAFTPLSTLRMVELINRANILEKGVLQVVVGGAFVGETLCSHPNIAKVSFTGSTVVGKKVASSAAASNLKAVSLELGGKSANIIFDDVPDIDGALDRSFTAMFSHKGEKCSEPTRLLIHMDHYKKSLSILKDKAEAVICGDAFSERAQQGAQCHREHYEKILSYIKIGKEEGATLLAGGTHDPKANEGKGFFVRPTIFCDVKPKMRIAQEEIFGPVLSIIPFKTEEEAIEIANDTTFGLAAGFWSRDVSRVHRVARQLEAGMIFVNRYGCYDFASPFGGFKQSGWGKEMAIHSLYEYTKTKSIWVKL